MEGEIFELFYKLGWKFMDIFPVPALMRHNSLKRVGGFFGALAKLCLLARTSEKGI